MLPRAPSLSAGTNLVLLLLIITKGEFISDVKGSIVYSSDEDKKGN
jgi:hypothetical protein